MTYRNLKGLASLIVDELTLRNVKKKKTEMEFHSK